MQRCFFLGVACSIVNDEIIDEMDHICIVRD